MKDEKYIEAAKVALDSNKTVTDKIADIATLELPHNAPPLIVLIHGDSQQLKSVVNYAENEDPFQANE